MKWLKIFLKSECRDQTGSKNQIEILGLRSGFRNQIGMSILELVITIGILSIVGLVSLSILQNLQNANLKKIADIGLLQTEALISEVLWRENLCTCHFSEANNASGASSLRFDSTQPNSRIMLPKLVSGCSASDPSIVERGQPALAQSRTLFVESIAATNFRLLNNTDQIYQAQLVISFKENAKSQTQRKPIEKAFRFRADPSSPANSRRITSCSTEIPYTSVRYDTDCGFALDPPVPGILDVKCNGFNPRTNCTDIVDSNGNPLPDHDRKLVQFQSANYWTCRKVRPD